MSVALYFVGEKLQMVFPKHNLNEITRSFAFSALALLVLIIVVALTPTAEYILRFTLKPLSQKLWLRFISALSTFKSGLQILRSPSEYPLLILQSCLIWLFYILPVYVMFFAFDSGPFHALNFVDACVILLVMAIATTITPPVPGAFIVIPTILTGALIPLFDIAKEDAAAYSLLTFMLNYIPVTIVGGLFMIREQVKPTLHVTESVEKSE
jgi:uncharacterized membrane protein YbhN (UPF0104 family)